jgi:hypothetical protein
VNGLSEDGTMGRKLRGTSVLVYNTVCVLYMLTSAPAPVMSSACLHSTVLYCTIMCAGYVTTRPSMIGIGIHLLSEERKPAKKPNDMAWGPG